MGLLLLAAAYRYARPVDKVLDIGFDDETFYLNNGLHLTEENLHTLRAPLYAVWYAALAHVDHDPLSLYDLNLRLQIILLPLVLFIALLLSRISSFWAFLLGWGWLITDANLEPWPRVSAFAWIILLLGIGLYQHFRKSLKGWFFLLTAVGLSMYARPEMMVPFVLLTAMGIWKAKKRERKRLVAWVSVLLLFLIYLFGSPNEPGRLFEAFGQHFAFRWQTQYTVGGSPWNHWQDVLNQAFKTQANSFSSVLGANPSLFAAHLWANVHDVPKQWAKLLFSHTPYLFRNHSLWDGILWMVTGVLLGTISLWCKRKDRVFWESYGFTFLILGILALPSVGSVVLIYPRQHYLLGPTLLMWYGWGIIVFGEANKRLHNFVVKGLRSQQVYVIGGLVAVFLTATTPRITAHFGFSPILDVRQTLVTLRALQSDRGITNAAVPREVWGNRNVQVYLPHMHFLFIDPSPSALAKGLPKTQVIVLDNGNVWLNTSKGRALLEKAQRDGWFILCTSRKPYLILTRVTPTRAIPMTLCKVK